MFFQNLSNNFSLNASKPMSLLTLGVIVMFFTGVVFLLNVSLKQIVNFTILICALSIFTHRHYIAKIIFLVIELLLANFSYFYVLPITYFFGILGLSVFFFPILVFLYFSFFLFIIYESNKYRPFKKLACSQQTHILTLFVDFIIGSVSFVLVSIFFCLLFFIEGIKNPKTTVFLLRVCAIDFCFNLSYFIFVRVSFVVCTKLILIYYGSDLVTTLFQLGELLDSLPSFDNRCCQCEGEESSSCYDDLSLENRFTDLTALVSSSEEESIPEAVDSSFEVNSSDLRNSSAASVDSSGSDSTIMSLLHGGLADSNLWRCLNIENLELLDRRWYFDRILSSDSTAGGQCKNEAIIFDIRNHPEYKHGPWYDMTHPRTPPSFQQSLDHYCKYYIDPYDDGISALGSVDSQEVKQSAAKSVCEPHFNVPLDNVSSRLVNYHFWWKKWQLVFGQYPADNLANKLDFCRKSNLYAFDKHDDLGLALTTHRNPVVWLKDKCEQYGWFDVEGANPSPQDLHRGNWFERIYNELDWFNNSENMDVNWYRVPLHSGPPVRSGEESFSAPLGDSGLTVFHGRIVPVVNHDVLTLPDWWKSGPIEWPERPSFLKGSHHVGGLSFQGNGCERLPVIDEATVNENVDWVNNGKLPIIGTEISFRQNPLHIWDHAFRDYINDAPWPLRGLHDGQCQLYRIPNDAFQEHFIKNVLANDLASIESDSSFEDGLGSIASIESDLSFEDEKLYKW